MTFDRGNRNAQLSANFGVAQTIDLGQQKGPFDRRGQAVEQLVKLHQGLQDDRAFFFTGGDLLGHPGQCLQVSTLQVLATVVVEQYALGHHGQKRPGFVQGWGLARGQQAHERVLGQVGGTLRATELAPQPAREPAVVVLIQNLDGV